MNWCVKEVLHWFGLESDSVPALFAYFLYWFRESKVADKAKHQAMLYQTASTSADEPTTLPLSFSESITDFSKLRQRMIRQYRVYEQPLLAQFETWMSSLSGALRRLLLLCFKKVD